MRLKKLVLDGFKSFGRKTEFTFEPGITSIVGPNGCGKSNVVDAFRWVLGISSAKAVRGDNMTDMIFDGAARLARAQYAQVSLTFDNSDGFFHRISSPEIEISRKLTRDGKSQYYLNGEPCRLKDFKSLFQDTGIGVEAYSIIEQGKVDALLSTDPKERRKIFEEAAGINRYKSQRHEAELRLARTEDNLARLTDIINEVKGQIRRVKTQATKAERWKEYTRELNALKTHRSLREYRKLHTDREKWLMAAAKAGRELDQHEEMLDKERSKALEAQARFDELMAEMNVIRTALHDAEKKITQHETSLHGHKRRLDEIDERRRRMRHARVVAEGQKENFEKRKAHSEQQLDELEREQAVCEAKFNALSTREYDLRSQIEGQLASARERQEFIEQLNRRRDALSTSIAQLDADIRIAATDAEKLTRQLAEQDTRAGELERRVAELTSEANDAREKRDELVGLLQGAADAQAKLATQIEESLTARQAEAEALAADESRMATLREVFESNALMGAGSKALVDDLKLGEKFRVRGRVSELISVPDELTRVVEAVLGPLGSAVVVGDDADAFGALEHLAKNKLGGAQLLSSDSLGKIAVPALDLPDSAAPLADLCKAASREGKPVLQGLLGQIVLVKDLAAAQKLIRSLPETVGLVTRQAEVIRRPATFTGRPEAGGVISSRTQLAEVEKRVVERRLRVEDMDKALAELRANRNPGDDRQRELEEQRQQISLQLGELESEKRHLEKDLHALESARHQTRRDREAAEEARDDAQDRLAEARTRLGGVEDEQMKAAAVSDDGADLTTLQERHLHLQAELTDARVTLAEVSQRLVGHREALKHMAEGILMNERDISRLDEEGALLDGQEAESKEIVKTASSELEALRETAIRHRTADQARERDVAVLRQQVATGQMNLETALSRCEGTRTQLNEARHREEACAERMNDLQTRVRDELSVDLEELLAEYHRSEVANENAAAEARAKLLRLRDSDTGREESTDAAELDDENSESETTGSANDEIDPVTLIPGMTDAEIVDRMDDLQEKIRRLGPVNLAALDELAELQEKHDAMARDEADLTAARNSIRKLVADIDSRTRRMFSETFEVIRNNFQRIFRKLFNGGAADVYLTDPSDVLISGIEIKARPPGCEPRTLTLLSGGQRSMIAIAMLFAIFEAKPSPFCILDEVDAALDDANTGRIGALLQEFVDRSQFLVITHSKATMSVADLLYGITMQEQGVSKKIQIRFEQVHETEDGELDFSDEPEASTVVA